MANWVTCHCSMVAGRSLPWAMGMLMMNNMKPDVAWGKQELHKSLEIDLRILDLVMAFTA